MMKGDFPVGEFAGRKTPFYFYDLPLLERTLDAVRSELKSHPRWQVHYAVKANANPEILRRIAAAGFGILKLALQFDAAAPMLISWKALGLGAALGVLYHFFGKKLHPIAFIGAGAVCGLVMGL